MQRTLQMFLVGSCAFLIGRNAAHAATRTWTGGGVDNNWTNAANWGGTAPVAGDDLVFPSVNLRLSNTNNFAANTVFNSITISGTNYVINGNAITNNAGITNSSPVATTNTFNCAVTLGANQTFHCVTNTTLILNTNLAGNLKNFTLQCNGTIIANGVLSGAGQLFKNGGGTLELTGSNTYGSQITVVLGRLVVRNSSALGLTVQQTTVNNGTSLELEDNISVPEPIVIGTATLRNISGTNTLTGTNSFTVGNTIILVETNSSLVLSNVLNSLGGFTKTGPGVMVLAGNTNNAYLAATFVNEGTLVLNKAAGTNAIPGALTIGDAVGGVGVDVVRLAASNQIARASAVTVNSSGLLDLNGKDNTIGSLTMDGGSVSTGGGLLTLNGNVTNTASTVATTSSISGKLSLGGTNRIFNVHTNGNSIAMQIAAVVSDGGGAGLIKSGEGILSLTGTNTYAGNTVLSNGTLLVNGSQPGSAVTLNGGTLGGSGTVGTITSITSGKVSPGANAGILTCSNVAWNSNTTFFVELNGTTVGSGYDQLKVNGTIDLANATLAGTAGFKANIGLDSFIVIQNNGTDPIVGTFAGLPEGASTMLGGMEVAVHYAGGDGNDVELVALNNFAIWDGGGGANTNWSNGANWVGDTAPVSGDSVLFPVGAPALTNFNDLTDGIFLRTVRIADAGYSILGSNQIQSWSFLASNTNGEVSFASPLRGTLNPFVIANAAGGTLNLNGLIGPAGGTQVLAPTGTMVLNGHITNNLSKRGPGVLRVPAVQPLGTGVVQIEEGVVQTLVDRPFDTASAAVHAGARLELVGARVITNTLTLLGTLAVSDIGVSNRYSGKVFLQGSNSTMEVASNSDLVLPTQVFDVEGTNSLTKTGPGRLYLTGPINTYGGATIVNDGALFMNSPSTFNYSTSAVVNAGGTLAGSGVVGSLTCNAGGTVAPSAGPDMPAGLLVNGRVTLQSNSVLRILLNGTTPGSGYSQLKMTNSGLQVFLNSPTLELVPMFTPAIGDVFVIFDNQTGFGQGGPGFNGLPQFGTFTSGDFLFRINYSGGNGNDVTVSRVTPPPPGMAAIPISSGPYTQDFDTLSSSGFINNVWSNANTLPGWYASQSASPFVLTNYRSATGSDNSGSLYSFGATSSGERALGSISSATPGTIGFGLCFTNDTGQSASNCTITYTGEQWRCGGSGSVTNTLTFWYRVSPSLIPDPEPATAAGWTAVTALDFASPTVLPTASALDGNQPTNQHPFVAVQVSGLNVPAGQNVFFRWLDVNDTGADQGIAVDNLSVTFVRPAPRISSIVSNSTNGFAQISGLGEAGTIYGIEAASNLNLPIFWQRIGSNTADGTGLFQFTDTNAPTLPMRFYRALFP